MAPSCDVAYPEDGGRSREERDGDEREEDGGAAHGPPRHIAISGAAHEDDDVAEEQPAPPAGDRVAEDVLQDDDVGEAHAEGDSRVAANGGDGEPHRCAEGS